MTSTSELTSLRYVAPTCTLELTAELSPLSQLAEKPILKRLRFEVQIRDRAGNAVVEVRGMRSHLLALSNTVQDYVHDYLTTPVGNANLSNSATPEGIALRANSLTHQTLHLGNLAPAAGPQQVGLSTVQLADLADVLDQMHGAVAILPADALPGVVAIQRRSSHRRAWMGTAAAGLLVAVGVSAVLPGVLNQSRQPQSEATAPSQGPQAEQGRAGNPGEEASRLPTSRLPGGAPAPAPEIRSQPAPGAQPAPANPAPGGSGQSTPPLPGAGSVASGRSNQSLPNPAAPDIARAPSPEAAPRTTSRLPESGDPATAASQPAEKQPPSIQANPSSQADQTAQAPATLSAPEPQAGAAPLDNSANAGAASRAVDEAAPARSLAALRASLEQQWQPPEGLAASITYTLVIDPAGVLQRVIPQDSLSRTYRDRIPVPPSGSAVIVPQASPQSLKLTLFPSGTVLLEPLTTSP